VAHLDGTFEPQAQVVEFGPGVTPQREQALDLTGAASYLENLDKAFEPNRSRTVIPPGTRPKCDLFGPQSPNHQDSH